MGVLRHVSEVGSRAGDCLTFLGDFSTPWRARSAKTSKMAVKTADKPRRPAYNEPKGNFRQPTLVLLCFAVLWLLASCGEDQPAPPLDTPIPEGPTETLSPTPTTPANPSPSPVATPTMAPEPAATEAVRHADTEASNAEKGNDDGIKITVQQLFDTWNLSRRESDAALFHSILTRDLAESCELEEIQSWLDQGEMFLGEVEVRSVFLAVADPSRAYAEIPLGESGGRPEQSFTYPWPVALEDGKWRAGLPTLLAGLPPGRCPFMASSPPSGPDGREREFPQIPGLELERRGDVLAAVPGTRVLHSSYRTGNSASSFSSGGTMSPNDNQINIYAELETDSATAEVARLYRDVLMHPSWDIIDEGSSGDFGWFSWTVLDGEGRLWRGRLVVAPLHEGLKQVWLSLYSDDPDDGQ